MILLDNYDIPYGIFTELGSEVKIVKNDELSIENIISMKPHGLVILGLI